MTYIRSVCALIIIVVIVLAVTNFSDFIQNEVGSVLGVQIAPKQTEPLPDRLQNDVNTSLKETAEKGKEIKVEDVIRFFGQSEKILDDYQAFQKELEKTVAEFYQEKKEEK